MLVPYERKAQLGREQGVRGENDGSAFFLAQPFCSPQWSSSKGKDAGPETVCWLFFSGKMGRISCNPLTAVEQVKGKSGFNKQRAIAAAVSRKAFLEELWDKATGAAVGGEETNPKGFGLWPLALMAIENSLLSAAHNPALPSRHLNARKMQTNQRESGEQQLG